MPHLSKTTNLDGIQFEEQASAPATPASGYGLLYLLANGLRWLDDGGNEWRAGVRYSSADVSNPPTDAELDAAFGTPAAVGAAFLALVNDAGAGANLYLVGSDGANWWYVAMMKAV